MKRDSKAIKQGIFDGLQDAVGHSGGTMKLATHTYSIAPLQKFRGKDIRTLRSELSFTQGVLARTLGVSLKTIEAWESGRNIPQGPAQRMLEILKKRPSMLKEMKIIQEERKNSA